ncbi:uncharacterized protein LOC128160220 [Crassostrea angulata]|uniref:uncharacterized protein LOC128160220 n=1 Tax=Magallana angulata TaxID=2784310 RepID=UPI0022B11AE3|nr:uncharacterized protein LOC128160220 [Crassostrea angulata]
MKMDSNHTWLMNHICKGNDYAFWLVASGCLVVGVLIGLLAMGITCRIKSKRSGTGNCQLRSSKGTFYFDDNIDLSRKPTEFNATSNFYIQDITNDSSTSSQPGYENQRHRKLKPPPEVPKPEIEESDDDQAEADDYIKMVQPKGSLHRGNSKQRSASTQPGGTAMYISM